MHPVQQRRRRHLQQQGGERQEKQPFPQLPPPPPPAPPPLVTATSTPERSRPATPALSPGIVPQPTLAQTFTIWACCTGTEPVASASLMATLPSRSSRFGGAQLLRS